MHVILLKIKVKIFSSCVIAINCTDGNVFCWLGVKWVEFWMELLENWFYFKMFFEFSGDFNWDCYKVIQKIVKISKNLNDFGIFKK